MNDRLRIAVVGVGLISEQSHIPAVLAHPRATLAALVDPAIQRAERLAREFGVSARVVGDLGAITEHVDAVIIATPNNTHAALACQALAAGCHVLVEKPLAATVEEGRSIVAAAEQAGKIVATGYSTRFRDNVLTVAQLLRENYFGAIRRFAYQFGTAGGWPSYSAYNISREATGGGVLMVTGTHFLDRMLYFFGYPDEWGYEDDAEGGPEANAVAHFRFQRHGDTYCGAARFSKTVSLPAGLVIEAEAGTLLLAENDSEPPRLRPADKPGIELSIETCGQRRYRPDMGTFLRQLDDFIDACVQKRSPMVSAHDGLDSLELIESLYADRSPMMGVDWYERLYEGGA